MNRKFKGGLWTFIYWVSGIILFLGLLLYLDKSGIIDINKTFDIGGCIGC